MRKKLLLILILITGLGFGLLKQVSAEANDFGAIDVVLENQNEDGALGNGCEVTALSMLLRHQGYQVNKNQLAEMLTYVPLWLDEKTHGNPKDGFVGDINGGNQAMGVGVEPLVTVARKIVGNQRQIISQRGMAFERVVQQVQKGNPVWVATTVDFKIPDAGDLLTWQTTDGEITVNRLCHAAVITKISDSSVWVNDPYGMKNRQVERDIFEATYQSMKEQALYLE